MKKVSYILFVVLVAQLLSSCGSLSISQKRYSRGLNIGWFSKNDEKPPTKIKKKISQSTFISKGQEIEIMEKREQQFFSRSSQTTISSDHTNISGGKRKSGVKNKSLVHKNTELRTLAGIDKFYTNKTSFSPENKLAAEDAAEGNGALRTIGWIFIILGIIILIAVSIFLGIIFMLLGLVFVLAGG